MNDTWSGEDKICRSTGSLSIEDMHYLFPNIYGDDQTVSPLSQEEIDRMEEDLRLFLSGQPKEEEDGQRTGKLQPQKGQEGDETGD
jgi:hypothetical protein